MKGKFLVAIPALSLVAGTILGGCGVVDRHSSSSHGVPNTTETTQPIEKTATTEKAASAETNDPRRHPSGATPTSPVRETRAGRVRCNMFRPNDIRDIFNDHDVLEADSRDGMACRWQNVDGSVVGGVTGTSNFDKDRHPAQGTQIIDDGAAIDPYRLDMYTVIDRNEENPAVGVFFRVNGVDYLAVSEMRNGTIEQQTTMANDLARIVISREFNNANS
ncbi:MAG: hypothetical protein ACOYN3_02140 [Acidimicrobiia bacterium]